ncbi:hypothetical protein ACF0H5_000791 [Mactra antiquata]
MDYTLIFTICVTSVCIQSAVSKQFTFETENFVSATKRVPRSSASGNFSVHLQNNDIVRVEFCLKKKSMVSVFDVAYSNDGAADTIQVIIDGQLVGSFQSDILQGRGKGWNLFKSSRELKRKLHLHSGRHIINLKVNTDRWGVELDKIVLNIDDDMLSYEDIICNMYCSDIKYDNVPRIDSIPSGRFVQKSTHTECSEQDNVKVEIYHDTSTSFQITASLPKYVSFANNRDPNYSNCKLASPYWIFRDQEVSTSIPEVQSDGAMLQSSGMSNRVIKIVTFNFRSLTPTRELDERLIGSILYMKLRNMPRENVRVNVEYLKDGKWLKLPEKEFTPFDNEMSWIVNEREWDITDDNKIKLTIEPGKQRVVIETLKLERSTKPDIPIELFSDDNVVFQGVKLGAWHHWSHRPNSMTIQIQSKAGNNEEHIQIDSMRVYARIPWTGSYAQVFVIFQDGRTRLQAMTPHGLDYIPFGSSVYIGQPESTNQERPYSPVDKITIDPKRLQMVVTYVDGGTALLRLDLTHSKTTLIVKDVNFKKNRRMYPVMTFQSMWVHDGNADVDHVTINGDISRHVTSEWSQLFGISAVFFKKCISEHNTQGPDIAISFT